MTFKKAPCQKNKELPRSPFWRHSKNKVNPTDNVKAEGITEKLLNVIVLDDQPVIRGGKRGVFFRSLIEHSQPRYTCLSETALVSWDAKRISSPEPC